MSEPVRLTETEWKKIESAYTLGGMNSLKYAVERLVDERLSTDERVVKLGVIEFHSERFNPGLIKRFYEVTKDLRDSGSIVDLWLMDIATVLKEFGYEMQVTTKRELPYRLVTKPKQPGGQVHE